MASPPSLRTLYKSQHDIWSFPQGSPSMSGSIPGTSTSNSTWNLPKQLPSDAVKLSDQEDLVPANVVLNGLLASALMQYSTAAIAMPWEVGKLLLQIQHVPQMIENPKDVISPLEQAIDVEQETSDSEDSYFHDPDTIVETQGTALRPATVAGQRHSRKEAETDGHSPASLNYMMPIGPSNGVWGMMKRVGRWRSEGWSSLFKGLLTASVTDALSSVIQPLMHNLLISVFPYTPQSNSLLVPVLSHLCTGVLLSPLDLVRTRLIAQSATAPFRSYTGPIDALSHILREEGGFKSIYLHPHVLLPAILENTLRPFVTLSLPFIVGGSMRVNEERTIGWMVIEFLAGCAGLLITLPIETIRRRLQIQTRGTAKPLKTCVHTRRKPYHGIIDAFWRIMSEECSDGSPLTANRQEDRVRSQSWYSRHGLGQLYRGFGMGIGASTIVLFLAIVTGSHQSDTGWTEL